MTGSSALLYVFVSILLGMMAFALTAAASTWWQRNKTQGAKRDPLPLFRVILKFLALSGCCIAIILSVRLMLPYEITSVQGFLKGDPIFPIRAIDGYEAGLQEGDGNVDAAKPLVTYQRKLAPTEIAEKRLERQLLVEQVADAKSRAEYRLAKRDPLKKLQEMSQVANLRTARILQVEKYNRAAREVERLKFKLDEQTAGVSLASKELSFARDAIKNGLVSNIEYDRRRATLKMEQSRLDGVKSQYGFAVQNLLPLSNPEDTENQTEINQALQIDSIEGGEFSSGDSLLDKLNHELRELDRVLSDEPVQPVTIFAPWDGFIGYRNRSTMPAPGELIGALVQSDSMFLEVLVPTSLAMEIAEGAEVKVFSEELLELGVTLKGHVRSSMQQNPQQTLLDVRLEHRSALIRDLALGNKIMLTVSFLNKPSQIISDVIDFVTNTSSRYVAVVFFSLWFLISLFLIAIYRLERRVVYNQPGSK
jgi:hypothetical protein